MSNKYSDLPEGDKPDISYGPALIIRLLKFLKPHKRLILISSLLIIVSTGIELLMPVITRYAVDSYLVSYHIRMNTVHMPAEFLQKLSGITKDMKVLQSENEWYIHEKYWRKFDPSFAAQLRKSGVVDLKRWYLAPEKPEALKYARSRPDIFTKAGNSYLISEDNLENLNSEELTRLRFSDAAGLVIMAVLYLVCAVLILIVSYYQNVNLEKAGQNMIMDMRLYLYEHILSRSLLFFSRNPVGKLVTRINNDSQKIADLFRNMLTGLFKDIFLFAGIAIVMFALNPRLAAVCMAIVPVMAAITAFFSRFSKQIFRRIQGYTGRLNTMLQEALSGLAAVKLTGSESFLLQKLFNLNTNHYRAGIAQTKMFAVFTPLMELVGAFAVALIVWYGGGKVIQDRLSLGTLVAFISYMEMLLIPVRDLSDKYNYLQEAISSTERIYTLLDDQDTLEINNGKIPESVNDIVFESVSFGYNENEDILQNFDLAIPAGQKVTLVGPSGGGKSTLVNLLLRLYDPGKGSIQFGGMDLKSIHPQELSGFAALVSQEIILLSSTLEYNITLGRDFITNEMLLNAVEISGISGWLNDLSDGLQTRIGEGGRQLSQGQFQMISLARALAGDPGLLILDEAFSRIDPETEKIIYSKLPTIMKGRTCVTVAHRIASARKMDRIIVIRDGKIAEDGSHDALIESGSIYAGMVELERIQQNN
ncbi:MAG: ABC transporter ATP-binding protein [Spirochaetes bacterium]|nr:ABC transporter ATP-binding protein [Spirochaetota bacterium]